MSLRELTALVLLYRACGDESLRQRVLELVPDLSCFMPRCSDPAGCEFPDICANDCRVKPWL